jgi:hypothetical protein
MISGNLQRGLCFRTPLLLNIIIKEKEIDNENEQFGGASVCCESLQPPVFGSAE